MTPLVTFWLVLVMPNHEPLRLTTPMSLAECLFEVNEFLAKPGRTVALSGGIIQAGCRLQLEPSLEH
jgi:hypothetical protein